MSNPTIAAMTDAEVAAEIERLTREMDALCASGMVPEPSNPAAPRWKALKRKRRELEKERNRRAEAALRTMSSAEVAAARRSQEYELRLLAESEHTRREREAAERAMPRFERMTFEELMQFAADPRGATVAEIKAAKDVMWELEKKLGNARYDLIAFMELSAQQRDVPASEPEQVAPPQRRLEGGER
jgi:hypothetical protein